ncbi:23S rRNA (cytidine(2498)-2'-O)-methyltransferase RlmM [Methylocaldum sp.]|uniref:23S rRNA (cytidine(2498)-2'-O)-methyltransferase RlmM n=1 Tax=Methylocaldum sp. TaxID=1969727 RepID=UPI002D2F18B7|nr:23S rRNA (cytidine(2498)-2'-O)-methyltransferase RlmM [Methylocaldum sp.]HYE36829.1 23S rRNA (cytidine(2498)-2'-O)-methyltransferase RlmM [Methylocaldum sp.]
MNTVNTDIPDRVLLYCRGGFEKECAAEILERTRELGVSGHAKAKPDCGFVVFVPDNIEARSLLGRSLRFDDLVFARQLVFAVGPINELPVADRTQPLLQAVKRLGDRFSDVYLETADTNEAKSLSTFTRKFAAPFNRALKDGGLLGSPSAPRLHLFFLSSTAAYVGMSMPGNSCPWVMGIPRLRFPRGAPSRSTLKLEEAFLTFLDDQQKSLSPGMTAVDLGAAPGGWTWQLTKRHIKVTAVDNGKLDPALLDTGLVEHLRMDAFRYRPPKPVDWLVCDVVEQPARIAALIGEWIALGLCRRAIFNLKLPMNKRYEEVKRCRGIIEEQIGKTATDYLLAFKQLYHDRAEVTAYISRRAT